MKKLLYLAAPLLLAANVAQSQTLKINEIRIDNPSSPDFEYVELYNTGGSAAALDSLTLLVIGDGAGGSGTIEHVSSVATTGETLAAGGVWLVAEVDPMNFDREPDAVIDLTVAGAAIDHLTSINAENSDNVTYLIVDGFSGSNGQDLDTNDDGVLDITPWTSVVDAVSLVESVGSGDQYYGAALGGVDVGPDGSFVPSHAYRSPNGGAFLIGSFGSLNTGGADPVLEGTQDTPGEDNPAPTSVTLALSGSSIAETSSSGAITATVTRTGTSGDLTVDVSIDDGSEAILDNSMTFKTITILDGNTMASVDIFAIDDSWPDGNQTVTVTATPTGGSSETDTFDVLDAGGDAFSLIFNEINGIPQTDHDGSGGVTNDDEFVEIYNAGASQVDLTGYEIWDSGSLVHVFRDGTLLDPACSIVVFSGADYSTGSTTAFGAAEVQTASEGMTLRITDTGDTMSLFDWGGTEVHAVDFPDLTGTASFGSWTLNTDGDATSGYAQHTLVAVDPLNTESPGTDVGGTPFCTLTATTVVFAIPPSVAENAGPGAISVNISITPPFPTSDLTVFVYSEDSSEIAAPGPGPLALGTILAGTGSTAVAIPMDVIDDVVVDGTQSVTLVGGASGYLNGTFNVSVTDVGDVPTFTDLVINEIDVDTPGTDAAEFIELFNKTSSAQALDGLVLVLINGSNDLVYDAVDLTGQTIPADGFFVVGDLGTIDTNDSIQNGVDAIALYVGSVGDFPDDTPAASITNTLVDAVVYNGTDAALVSILHPGKPEADDDTNGADDTESSSRVPDGGPAFDTTLYVAQAPTPGFTNVIVGDPSITIDSATYSGGTFTIDYTLDGLTQIDIYRLDKGAAAWVEIDGDTDDTDGSFADASGSGAGALYYLVNQGGAAPANP